MRKGQKERIISKRNYEQVSHKERSQQNAELLYEIPIKTRAKRERRAINMAYTNLMGGWQNNSRVSKDG